MAPPGSGNKGKEMVVASSLVSDPRLKRPVCHPDPRAASSSQQNASCDYVPASHGRSIAGVVACEMIWDQMLVGSSTCPASSSFLVFLCLQPDLSLPQILLSLMKHALRNVERLRFLAWCVVSSSSILPNIFLHQLSHLLNYTSPLIDMARGFFHFLLPLEGEVRCFILCTRVPTFIRSPKGLYRP